MISYGRQSISPEDIDAVVRVLRTDLITQGPFVEKFEQQLGRKFGSRYAIAVANGTAALHLSGLALGWQKGDIVITSPLTFVATANAVIYAGATPDFTDIEPNHLTIDPNRLEEKVRNYAKKGKKVKAVIGVDFAGHPCDWESLASLAKEYEFQLVNDQSHALGACYKSQETYAVKYADIATSSFHPVKLMTTGEGGVIFTNDSDLAERVATLRTHGISKGAKSEAGAQDPWWYEMRDLGFNYRLTDFQSALGISQLRRLDQFIEKRKRIAQQYDQMLSKFKSISRPRVRGDSQHAYHLYVIELDFKEIPINRKDLFEVFENEGIRLQVHYIPVHFHPYYQENFGFRRGQYPVAEAVYENMVSLPIYVDLEDADVEMTVEKLSEYCRLE